MHEDHRERMRQRFLQNGAQNFATHELLEMLLYYSIPRADTNPTAHLLLESFGSLRGVLNAAPEELQEVLGVGERSAVLLKLLPELARRYANERDANRTEFSTVSSIAQYFCNRMLGVDRECLYIMLLNNRMQLIDCQLVSQGTVNSSSAPIGVMSELALRKKASAVVLAHNHPNGLAVPSTNDLTFTDQMSDALRLLSITLLEHLIIAEDRFCPILEQRNGHLRRSPITGCVESKFYDRFYDVNYETWVAKPAFD